ncbi:MAG: UDP-N-acetylmuramoyl-L-alanine--D-glutamate ligase [Gammaproteobacteria bacterium]|jgi:UDP-N-acetylmuramoylalanine--D-glutamate ligase|nr:UDP-N-acetylmuramoyl-L-alanine--D-glutamate ligase [Gammaproteobacteria bacterium]
MGLYTVVLGLGKTGLSCVRYLIRQGKSVVAMDSREQPPELAALRQEFPRVPVYLGAFAEAILAKADEILVSPGISLQEPAIQQQLLAGKPIIGDIELFARAAKAPIVAITGSNGKSTVTTLLGEMVKQAGLQVHVAGNIGLPVLDTLQQPTPDWYVLELSSFQLETTTSLRTAAATILNITEDHMDRYANFAEYKAAKQRIYRDCNRIVYNRQDAHTQPEPKVTAHCISFGIDESTVENQYGLLYEQEQLWLAKGREKLLAVSQLKLMGKHNWTNALAALGLGEAMGLPLAAMLVTLKQFHGLAHRCEWVGEMQDVQWYNDSKATNVGAAIAAIEGLGQIISGKLIVLAGGVGKEADFSPLRKPLADYARAIVLFGVDAPEIAKIIPSTVLQVKANDMSEAITIAQQQAKAGDAVLLAPACASFDMFNNFEHRGEIFKTLVRSKLV